MGGRTRLAAAPPALVGPARPPPAACSSDTLARLWRAARLTVNYELQRHTGSNGCAVAVTVRRRAAPRAAS